MHLPASSPELSQGKRLPVANPEGATLLIMQFHVRIDCHGLVYGGMNVGRGTWIGSGFGSLCIARTINLSATNPSAGKNQ